MFTHVFPSALRAWITTVKEYIFFKTFTISLCVYAKVLYANNVYTGWVSLCNVCYMLAVIRSSLFKP